MEDEGNVEDVRAEVMEVVKDEDRVRDGGWGDEDVSSTSVVGSVLGRPDPVAEDVVGIGGNVMTPLPPEGGNTRVAVMVPRVG